MPRAPRGAAVLLIGMWAIVLVMSSSCHAAERVQSFDVQITLEDSVFLEGQSIFAMFCFRNHGSAGRDHVLPLSPEYGFTRLELIRADSGERIPYIMPTDGHYVGKGKSVGANRSMCEARDLTLYFGITSPGPSTVAGRLGYPNLPAGNYVLRWSYTTAQGGSEKFKGTDIRFSVKPLSSDPTERALMEEFLAGLPSVGLDRSALHRYALARLPRFYASRYLLRVYMSTGTLLRTLDFDKILMGVIGAGVPSRRRAALLAARLSMRDYQGRFTEEWKDSVRPKLASEIERDVLTIEPGRP